MYVVYPTMTMETQNLCNFIIILSLTIQQIKYSITMTEISTVNGLSVNAVQNAQLKRKYDKHIHKIMQISQKKSSVKLISQQQKKISEILKRSKQASRHFKDKQFMVKCQAQNKRLMKSLSTINTRQRAKTQRDETEFLPKQKIKTSAKEKVMREFQIQMENRKLAQNIMGNVCDVLDYRKKMRKEIAEYERLKNHLQRLKPSNLEKITPPQDIHSSVKLKLKTHHNQLHSDDKQMIKPKTMVVRQRSQH